MITPMMISKNPIGITKRICLFKIAMSFLVDAMMIFQITFNSPASVQQTAPIIIFNQLQRFLIYKIKKFYYTSHMTRSFDEFD